MLLTTDFTNNNSVQLIKGGRQYFDLLIQLIHDATESIHLQVYIFDDDQTGNTLATALVAAAARRVKVYVIVDGYASQNLSTELIHYLRSGGVFFRFFEPLFKSSNFYFGRRLHHKVVVIDTRFALVGGINISNRYNDLPGSQAWLDFALFVQGPIVPPLCLLCWKIWRGKQRRLVSMPCDFMKTPIVTGTPAEAVVRMRRNDWVSNKRQISKTYIEMMVNARQEIIILCSYFLPGRVLRRTMKRAVRRGVIIKVIMAGKSDLVIAKNAERFMYDWLLRNQVEIYEYQQNVLHGKLAVCDGEWLTIGSYNINDISAYASIELNLDVRDPSFAKQVTATLNSIIDNECIAVTTETHTRAKNMVKQFARWLSYQLFRVALFLFTFYFKQKN